MTNARCGTLVAVACLLSPAVVASQEATTVSGRVTSDNGQPLVAASVFIQSMNIGTTTRPDGTYSFTVPAARATGQTVTLTARLVGHRPRTAAIVLRGASVTQDFVLEPSAMRLSEVVVTGAGTTTEAEKLGVARARVDSSAIVRSNEANVVNALAAKAPNVTVLSSSGEPGASTYIQVRGLTSIASGNGQPLFVIDGLPVDNSTVDTPFSGLNGGTVSTNRLADLNPADIENVEILKGAAAGAIYGARAGQGVVLITTKKGRAGETRYSIRSNVSTDRVSRLPDLQNEFGVGTGGNTPGCYTSPTPGCALGFAAAGSWGPRLADNATRYDNRGNIFQAGLTADNSLSVSGGSERTAFYLSGGLLDQRGIIIGPNNEFRRYSVRFNGSHQVINALRVGVNATYASSEGAFVQSRNNTGGLLLGAWRSPIDFDNSQYLDPVSGLHRSYRYPNPAAGSERVSRRYDNPFFVAMVPPATSDVGRALGNVTAEYVPAEWLRVSYSLGSDFSNDERLEANPLSSSTGATPGDGQVIRASMRTVQIDHNLAATANYTLGTGIRGTVTVGQNLNAQTFRQNAQAGNVLVAESPYNVQNTSSQQAPVDLRTEVRSESYFGQATVDLYERLFLTLALRNDGFSTFGANSRRAWFPKGSASWSFLREPGLASQLVTFGKLRAAYGQSGTSPTPYQTQTVYSGANLAEGGWGPVLGTQQNGVRGLYSAAVLGNPNLGPERVGELELGFDVGLLRDRADVSVTHYRQKTTDAILQFPLSAAGGYTTQLRNVGELQNIGWEAALNLHPLRGRALTWDVGLFWSRNRNEVLSLRGANQVILNAPFGVGSFPQAIVREGEPMGIWLSDDFVRCGRGLTVGGVRVDETAGHCQGAPTGALYLGADGLPLKDQEAQYLIGNPNPDWQGGVRTSLTWRKLTVGGLLDVRRGGDVWNGTRTALNHFGRTAETARFREGTFAFGETYLPEETVAGPGANKAVTLGEGWFSGLGGVFNGPASFGFEDGSFAKLREISVGYLWDTPSARRLGFRTVELRVAGRNLYTWTDYTGVDPETSVQSAGTSVIRGVDYFNNPQTRSFVFTVSLNR